MIDTSQAFLLGKTVCLLDNSPELEFPSLMGLAHSPTLQPQHVLLAKGTLLLILLLPFVVSYSEPRIWLWYTQKWGRYSEETINKSWKSRQPHVVNNSQYLIDYTLYDKFLSSVSKIFQYSSCYTVFLSPFLF